LTNQFGFTYRYLRKKAKYKERKSGEKEEVGKE
jgi:hypothetical protein